MVSTHSNTANAYGQFLKIGQVSRRWNTHPQQIRRLAASGQLPVVWNGSQRRFKESDCLEYFEGVTIEEKELEREKGKVVLLARVSGAKQGKSYNTEDNTCNTDSDLSRQVETLKAAAEARGFTSHHIVSDIGSGLSFTRKNMTKFVDEILAGQWDGVTLLATFKDRVTRFGLDLYEQIFRAHNITLVFCEAEEEKTDEQEMCDDLLNILHIFSCKQYSRRGVESITKEIEKEAILLGFRLQQSGLSMRQIANQLNRKGYRAVSKAKGETKITSTLIWKHLNNETLLAGLGIGQEEKIESSFDIWFGQKVKVDGRSKVKSTTLWENYRDWHSNLNGQREELPLLSRQSVAKVMRERNIVKKDSRGGQVFLGVCLK